MREAGRRTRTLSLAGCCGLALLALAFAFVVEYHNWKADGYLSHGSIEQGEWRISGFSEAESPKDHARDTLRGIVISYGLPLFLIGPLTILWASGSTLRTLRDGTAALPLSLACLGAGILSTYLVVSRPVFETLGW